ncbi:RibD family protein [Myxococcus sp. K15C18031901]|uniref:RibD family protein n=1 Tax=Myxococcus dinghuensis TaxID=2906761 RepID=UPI0020A803B3|nr:RibD family protein [Myxococcus dinghuensis]MCP3098421.1 RibD family protein [Myxococcus dinghuensis]
MSARERPYVICHMAPSIDGRIITAPWKLPQTLYAEYERTAKTFRADAWMIGRVSMEPYAGKAPLPKRKVGPLQRRAFLAARDAGSYAIALDPSGRLRWRSNDIDGDHVVSVLTESVSDAYLSFLQSKGVSYVFGGRGEVNLRRVLEKLREAFGIERLLLEGGGKINGSFLAADLVDELSVLVAPVADGSVGTPTLFDAGPRPVARRLKLHSVRKRPGDLVWLRYTRAPRP